MGNQLRTSDEELQRLGMNEKEQSE